MRWSARCCRVALLVAAVQAATLLAAVRANAAEIKKFALVVGNNRSDGGLPALRYADDDAVRWTIVLRTFGADVEVLTELDAESRMLYGADAPATRAPSGREVDAAMSRLADRMRRARAAGSVVVFYFVYAGHGDAQDGEGYLTLADGRLLRHEFEKRILAASPADTNHVIIDACRSYYFAYDRGPGGSRRTWHEPYFDAGAAARARNTGFLLASSTGGATHEWEEFQAGIFSHEVRSGLLGGADADGDGKITYAELAAFIRVANQSVRNGRFRPDVPAQPPERGDDVLVDLRDATGGLLHLGPPHAARQVLEDELGTRWADIHPGERQDVTLALPAESWGHDAFFLRAIADGSEYRFARQRTVVLSDYRPEPAQASARGALHEAFAQLFASPFDITSLSPSTDLHVAVENEREPDGDGPAMRLRPIIAAELGATNALAREVPALLGARMQARSLVFRGDRLSLEFASGAASGVREQRFAVAVGMGTAWRLRQFELQAAVDLAPGVMTQSSGTSVFWSPTLSLSPSLGGALWLSGRVGVVVEARGSATAMRLEGSLGLQFGLAGFAGLLYAI